MKNYKKTFLSAVLIFWSIFANAQCDSYIRYEEDKMTGVGTWVANEAIILSHDGGTNGIAITILLSSDGKTIICSNRTVGAGCIDDNAKVEILFTDSSRVTLYADNKFNCQGKATIYFGGVFGKKKYLPELSEKSIETIRIWGRTSFAQEDLSSEDQDKFKNTIKCLMTHQKD